jgi:competence protein ComEC
MGKVGNFGPAVEQRLLRAPILLACALCLAQRVYADPATPACVAPSSDVTTSVTIRQAPTTSSGAVGRLSIGQQLPVTGEVPNWIQVTVSPGVSGFVSKRWTDPIDCQTHAPVTPTTGQAFELDAIDVGTGLSVFVHGPDFNLLYDAGSNDDMARGEHNRVVNYLRTVFPQVTKLDHLILSHPHQDHVELMADVVNTYKPPDVWDSGADTNICGYRAFLEAVAATDATYHNANFNAGDEAHAMIARTCYGTAEPAHTITLKHGARIDSSQISLGANARMTFLHVDGDTHSNLNENSLVVRLELGKHIVLFMGDGQGGERADPSSAANPKYVEGKLLACCLDQLRADLLIVGHHGSMTSSRKALLDAIGAEIFIVSAGPTQYHGVVLPDQVIIDELTARGTVWRTDTNDATCKTSTTKIGATNDGEAGGCSNVRVSVDDSSIRVAMYP